MKIEFSIFIPRIALAMGVYLATQASALAHEELFFHWATPNSNNELLHLAGYPDPAGHSRSLAPENSGVILNAPIFEKLRSWYENSGRLDAAGPGFYMSRDLFDSRYYGSDLLIVEPSHDLKSLTKKIVEFESKEAAEEALEKKSFQELPLSVDYRGTNWRVVLRTPNADEQVDLRIRPPTQGDVDRIWKYYEKHNDGRRHTLDSFVYQIAQEVLGRKKNPLPERSAEILFHRVLFDRGFEYLKNQTANSWIHSNQAPLGKRWVNSADAAAEALHAYEMMLPDDSRTEVLFQAWLGAHIDAKAALNSSDQLRLLASAPRRINDIESKKAAAWLAKNLTEETALLDMDTTLAAYDRFRNFFSSHEREILDSKLKAAVNSDRFKFRDAEGSYPIFKKFLNAQETKAALEKGFSGFLSSLQIMPSPLEGAEEVQEGLTSWLKVLGKADQGNLMPRVGQIFNAFKDDTFGAFQREYALLTLINFNKTIPDPVARKRLADEINKRLQLSVEASPQGYNINLGPALGSSKELGIPTFDNPAFVDWVKYIGDEHPLLIRNLRDQLITMMRKNPNSDVLWSSLLKYLKNSERKGLGDKGFVAQYFDTMKKALRSRGDSLPPGIGLEQFYQDIEKAWNSFPNSPQYSELSRTFVLVDPILVSEDLAINNARRPFERFNEQNIGVDGKLSIQPAWDNFNNTWEEASVRIWQNKHFDIGFDSTADWNLSLLATNVDGAANENLRRQKNWDRSKYTTNFSHEDWKKYELEKNRGELDKYFGITKTEKGYELKFRNVTDLKKSLPDLAAINRKTDIPAITEYIRKEVIKLKDPIDRAARILYLVPRLHPFENGNGRLARMWASAELVSMGLPVPLGLPTNDFVMSQERIRLEVQKATALGKFWRRMLEKAQENHVVPEDFFQSVFRNSPLEGFLHLSPSSDAELRLLVTWLEKQQELPKWGSDLAGMASQKINELRSNFGSVARSTEVERAAAMEALWGKSRAQIASDLKLSVPTSSCPSLFNKAAH